MPQIAESFARHFAQEWIAAWNAHDIERILAHYSDDFTFQSPFVISIAGEPSGHLKGKAAVRAYWTTALTRVPNLHFELLDVLTGVDCLTLHYRGHRGLVAETFFFADGEQAVRATACYSIGSDDTHDRSRP